MEAQTWHVPMFMQWPSSKTAVGVQLSWTSWRSWGKWPSRQTAGKCNHHEGLETRMIWSNEELETLPAGTKPRISYHRSHTRSTRFNEATVVCEFSPCGSSLNNATHRRERWPWQMVCVPEDLKCWGAWDTTCGHKAKDITPSITWRRKEKWLCLKI